MHDNGLTLRKVRWQLAADALRRVEHLEDGMVRVLAELYRAETGDGSGHVNRFRITEEFVRATFDRWAVDLVDTHDADLDANPTHIGGETEPVEIEKKTLATLAFLNTINTQAGRDFAILLKRHVENIKAGKRPIVTLSIGAHNVQFAKGQGPGLTDPPWDIVNGDPDHVMMVRAGFQAQENAGIRVAATMAEAMDQALIEAIRSNVEVLSLSKATFPTPELAITWAEANGFAINIVKKTEAAWDFYQCDQDAVSASPRAIDISTGISATLGATASSPPTPTAENPPGDTSMENEQELAALRTKAAEAEAAKAAQDAAETALTAKSEELKAATDLAAKLQQEKDDAEKAGLVDKINAIHKDLDKEAPASKDWDLTQTRAEYVSALEAHYAGPSGAGAVPAPDDAGSERDKAKGQEDDAEQGFTIAPKEAA